MEMRDLFMLGSFILTILGTSWKLHTEISTIKITLERLATRFEDVAKLEKRIDRLERKVFHLDNEDN
jgi:polyhydroxyalkanoate synthesis regulator phasin